jgi:hypothetical protein
MNIHHGLDYRKMLSDEICEPFLNEIPKPQLEDFLPAPGFGFPQGGGHVVSTPDQAWSNMIKRGAVPHVLVKLWQEHPEEQTQPPMLMPIGTGTGPKNTVLYGR